MKLNPRISLSFNGQCEAAFRLYAQCMNGTIAYMLTWADSPAAADAPPGWEAKIYHATLKIGDTTVAGGDVLPGRYEAPRGFQVLLQPLLADECVEEEQAPEEEHPVLHHPPPSLPWSSGLGSGRS